MSRFFAAVCASSAHTTAEKRRRRVLGDLCCCMRVQRPHSRREARAGRWLPFRAAKTVPSVTVSRRRRIAAAATCHVWGSAGVKRVTNGGRDARTDSMWWSARLSGLTATAVAARNARSQARWTAAGGRRHHVRKGFRFNQVAHALYCDGAGRPCSVVSVSCPRGKPPTRGVMGWHDGGSGCSPATPSTRWQSAARRSGREIATVLGGQRRRGAHLISAAGGSIRSDCTPTPS
jgi:hypothetical protein